MFIEIIPESEIDPTTDAAIRQGLCACFPPDVAVFSKTRAWHGSAPVWSVVVRHEGCVAAHTGVVDRTVRVGDRQIRVAGIQNLFVLPEYRGRGLCDQVMEAAMSEASKRDYDIGLLFCVPELARVYERCGWSNLGCRDVIRIDERGLDAALPTKNITMFYPLATSEFPDGSVHLQGNDW